MHSGLLVTLISVGFISLLAFVHRRVRSGTFHLPDLWPYLWTNLRISLKRDRPVGRLLFDKKINWQNGNNIFPYGNGK
jgi:hypothetical protein